jgi:hypothetical protein
LDTWRAAGFEPDPDTLAEYEKCSTPKFTMRPTLAAPTLVTILVVWAGFFQGQAIPAAVALTEPPRDRGRGASLQRHEWVARRDGEDRLRAEYQQWCRETGR